MKELGDDAKQLHSSAGEKIRAAGIDYLFTLGNLSKATSESFGKNAQHFTQYEELLTALKPYVKDNATILIKGSRSMRMETILYGLSSEIPHEAAH
jgi:UDP-N-acetylmuramoyl-tripeptide--D-alanyl-D-alanine ligase